MKKSRQSLLILSICGLLSSCGMGTMGQAGTAPAQQQGQPGMGEILGAILSGGSDEGSSVLGNIISTVTNGMGTTQNALVGSWTYSKPCVQFESDNLLSKAGGVVIAEKVENQLVTYYQKVGIKPGSCKFVFSKDNKLQYTIGSKTYTGTYAFNATNKTVTITTQSGNNVSAYVSIVQNGLGLTFDVSKLLTFIQSSAGASTQLGTISTIAQNYKGMKLGFEFVR